ncbi:MAG: hypothetical protein ACJ8R9_02810 [Steroidobacteraceae bacterium]
MRRLDLRILAAGRCLAVLPMLSRLARAGSTFQIQAFASPDAVGEYLQDWTLDLVFVDADSPDFSAAELCRALKAHPATKLLSILVISCSARACREALEAGADDFLTPEIPPEVVLTRMEALAGLSLQRRKRYLLAPESDDNGAAGLPLSQRQARLAPLPMRADEQDSRAAILGQHVRGYAPLWGCTSRRELTRFLNEYTALLNAIAVEHEGCVFARHDQLLLYFDWHQDGCGGSIRALNAAQQLLVKFGELSRRWYRQAGAISTLSIAVDEGNVSWSAGDPSQFESLTIAGDAVEVASGIRRRARAGEVLFSESVKRSLRAADLLGPVISIPPIALRGRAAALRCYCLRAAKRFDPYDFMYTNSGEPHVLQPGGR